MRRAAAVAAAGSSGALLWSAAVARRGVVDEREARWFRRVNGAPGGSTPAGWLVMQAGSLGAVPLAALVERRRRGDRSAVVVGVAGSVVWAGVRAVKPFVGRGRPASYLDDVVVRGTPQTGLGYPSGHAAVATALAISIADGVGSSVGGAAIATAVGAARIRVGAHLPLDVVGGAAIGILAGLVTRHSLG